NKMTAPGTSPEPSTRSNSLTPVGKLSACVASTSVMGRANSSTLIVVGAVRAVAGVVPASSMVPQAWHSPQRPVQFAVIQPHSWHLWAGFVLLLVLAFSLSLGVPYAMIKLIDSVSKYWTRRDRNRWLPESRPSWGGTSLPRLPRAVCLITDSVV